MSPWLKTGAGPCRNPDPWLEQVEVLNNPEFLRACCYHHYTHPHLHTLTYTNFLGGFLVIVSKIRVFEKEKKISLTESCQLNFPSWKYYPPFILLSHDFSLLRLVLATLSLLLSFCLGDEWVSEMNFRAVWKKKKISSRLAIFRLNPTNAYCRQFSKLAIKDPVFHLCATSPAALSARSEAVGRLQSAPPSWGARTFCSTNWPLLKMNIQRCPYKHATFPILPSLICLCWYSGFSLKDIIIFLFKSSLEQNTVNHPLVSWSVEGFLHLFSLHPSPYSTFCIPQHVLLKIPTWSAAILHLKNKPLSPYPFSTPASLPPNQESIKSNLSFLKPTRHFCPS